MAKTKSFNFGGKELSLRLDGQAIIEIENTLDKGLFQLLYENGQPRMPKISELLIILQRANKNHGLKQKDMIELYEKFMSAGKGYMDLYEVIQELIEESGFFGKKQKEDTKTDSESSEEEDNVLGAKIED